MMLQNIVVCDTQNDTLTLDNTWPQFTDCFMHTVLVWVPCAFLFVMLPYYVTSVNRMANRGTAFPVTLVNGARLVSATRVVG